MRKQSLVLAAAVAALAFAAVSIAGTMSTAEYTAAKAAIEARHLAAQKECPSQPGSPRAACLAQAADDQVDALSDLSARYRPTPESRQEARLAKAQSRFAVARQKCDDRAAGTARDACIQKAEAELAAERQHASAQHRSDEASSAAWSKAVEKRWPSEP